MPSYNAENFGLKDIFFACKKMTVAERLAFFSSEHDRISRDERTLYRRQIVSPQARTVAVLDPWSGQVVEMLMCGSNNYLGLADHPHVAAEIARLIGEYGSGIGGPPLLKVGRKVGRVTSRQTTFRCSFIKFRTCRRFHLSLVET